MYQKKIILELIKADAKNFKADSTKYETMG